MTFLGLNQPPVFFYGADNLLQKIIFIEED